MDRLDLVDALFTPILISILLQIWCLWSWSYRHSSCLYVFRALVQLVIYWKAGHQWKAAMCWTDVSPAVCRSIAAVCGTLISKQLPMLALATCPIFSHPLPTEYSWYTCTHKSFYRKEWSKISFEIHPYNLYHSENKLKGTYDPVRFYWSEREIEKELLAWRSLVFLTGRYSLLKS